MKPPYFRKQIPKSTKASNKVRLLPKMKKKVVPDSTKNIDGGQFLEFPKSRNESHMLMESNRSSEFIKNQIEKSRQPEGYNPNQTFSEYTSTIPIKSKPKKLELRNFKTGMSSISNSRSVNSNSS